MRLVHILTFSSATSYQHTSPVVRIEEIANLRLTTYILKLGHK